MYVNYPVEANYLDYRWLVHSREGHSRDVLLEGKWNMSGIGPLFSRAVVIKSPSVISGAVVHESPLGIVY